MNIKALLGTALIVISGTAAAGSPYVSVDQSRETQLCVAAAEGNRVKMHNAVKASGYSKRYILKNVTCNDASMATFITQHSKSPDAMLRFFKAKRFVKQTATNGRFRTAS